jgi:hypothetical protein
MGLEEEFSKIANVAVLQAIAKVGARAWVDQYYRYVFDHSGQRQRLLERTGSWKMETQAQWWEAHRRLTNLGRALLLDLENKVIPRLPDDLGVVFESEPGASVSWQEIYHAGHVSS